MKIAGEVAGAKFGDARLSKRLATICEQIAASPDESFPVIAGCDAAREGLYRFFGNEDVTPERILEPHIAATTRRVLDEKVALVVHDTTEFVFTGDRAEMGWVEPRKNGFFAHFALAVASDGSRRPLGIMGQRTLFRYGPPKNRSHRRRRRHDADSEERRWWDSIADVEALLDHRARAIHVMDREADSYGLLSQLVGHGFRFVIRMAFDRRAIDDLGNDTKVFAQLEDTPVLLTREVPLSRRVGRARPGRRPAHPTRSSRLATLEISATPVTLRRSDWAPKDAAEQLTVNVVRVVEVDAPQDCDPVEWRLVTSENIARPSQVAAVVDAYRARWIIKTGCAFEKRQLGSKRALLNALAVFTPIAWQLLLLRSVAREAADTPASSVLSPLRLKLLAAHPKLKMGAGPSVSEAMLAIAQLGGHIRNNGPPGWLVLGRGFEKLLLLEQGAILHGL
jgi:Transposase DNA-binding